MMSWIGRLLDGIQSSFTRQSHELSTEAWKWKQRAGAARRAGMHKLAADCDSYSARFATKQQEVNRSAAEAHGWRLEADG